MKKYLLITLAALLALPALYSCNKPTGDPEKDAEAFQGFFEDQLKLKLETQQKVADLAEYYAENEDYDAYKELQEEVFDIFKDLQEKYEDQHEELDEAIAKAEKKINKKNNKDDDSQDDDEEE